MFCQTDGPREGRAAHTPPNLQRILQTRALNLIAQIAETYPMACEDRLIEPHLVAAGRQGCSLKRPRVSGCVSGRPFKRANSLKWLGEEARNIQYCFHGVFLSVLKIPSSYV